jgi:hypothetical protein
MKKAVVTILLETLIAMAALTAVAGITAAAELQAVAGITAVTKIKAISGVIAGIGKALGHANAPPNAAWLYQANKPEQAAGSAARRSPDSPGKAPLLVPLQCRLASGPWRNCNMRVDRLGEHWWLELGGQLIEFRHDGHGNPTMRWPGGHWRPVNSSWQSDGRLCWDGICVRGAIPLD